jgi:hypothetical protein
MTGEILAYPRPRPQQFLHDQDPFRPPSWPHSWKGTEEFLAARITRS